MGDMGELGDCILYPAQSKCILGVSFISILTCSYALYCGHYDLAIIPGGVFITSVNYWRLPVYGWRRNLDIAYVCGAIIYQNIRAYNMSNAVPYYYLMGIGSLFYLLSNYLHKKKCYWGSTYTHCMLHVAANLANIVLYSGDGGSDGGAGGSDGGVDGGCGVCDPPIWSAASFCPLSYSCFFGGHIVCPIRCYGVS